MLLLLIIGLYARDAYAKHVSTAAILFRTVTKAALNISRWSTDPDDNVKTRACPNTFGCIPLGFAAPLERWLA